MTKFNAKRIENLIKLATKYDLTSFKTPEFEFTRTAGASGVGKPQDKKTTDPDKKGAVDAYDPFISAAESVAELDRQAMKVLGISEGVN